MRAPAVLTSVAALLVAHAAVGQPIPAPTASAAEASPAALTPAVAPAEDVLRDDVRPAEAAPQGEPKPATNATATGTDDSFTQVSESGEASQAGMMVGEEGPRLELYGFADFSYLHPFMDQDNILTHYVGPYPRFFVGHLNLYMGSTLGENWRTLSELRFTYSPTGKEGLQNVTGGAGNTPAADGSFPRFDSTAEDYGEGGRVFSWGGIELQRAWIEYQPLDYLAIRGGHWLTPYGYWNDDHGSPTIITVHKPFPIGEGFFPEYQTGLEIHGKYFVGFEAIGYALTLSNGRGPFSAFRDLDGNKAIGGRLYFETSRLGTLTVGVDVYRGRYTDSTKRFRIDQTSTGEPKAAVYRTTNSAFDELSVGADFRWLWGGLHLQGEVMLNEAAFDDPYRPMVQSFDPTPSFVADYRRVGAYLLAGYRTEFLNLMPYVMGEYSSYDNSDFSPPLWAGSAGLNLRVTPNVVLKAEVAYAEFIGLGSTGFGEDDLKYGGGQVAWAF